MPYDEDYIRLQIALMFARSEIEALQEALAEILPQVHGQSLDSWVNSRVSELVEESLRRYENNNPGAAATAQGIIDETRAMLAKKRKPQ